MRRYVHNFLATLLCVCLLISYTPLPASADLGDESAAAPSVGPLGSVDPITGTATTTLNVLAVDGLKLAVTPDFAASIDEIRGNAAFDLKVEAAGTKPFTYAWSRALLDVEGNPGTAELLEGATDATYPLSQHTDTLEVGKTYRYTVQVTDATGASKEASVQVTVSSGYVEVTLPDEATLPHVHGLSIHQFAELATVQLDDRSPLYGFLQQGAQGLKLDPAAWQLDLAGAPEEKPAFVGKLDVSLPLSAEAVAAGDAVKVVGIAADGAVTLYDVAIDAASSCVTFSADGLGAFAVAYPEPAGVKHIITAVAGEGGSITPDGQTEYAQGATAVYTVLPDEGYKVERVTVDGHPVELTGNTYTFTDVRDDHRIEAAFAKVGPVEPDQTHTVVARVEGGNGRVALGSGAPDVRVEAQVPANESALVQFVPDDGFAIQSVTLRVGQGAPQPVNVFGLSYVIPAVTDAIEVVVTYEAGTVPPVPVHEVTATATGGGSVSPEHQSVPHAGTAWVTVRADEGYELTSLLVNGADAKAQVDAGGTLVLQNVVCDTKVEAVFELSQVDPPDPEYVTVHAQAGEGGSISPAGEVRLLKGGTQTFRFQPDAGKRVSELTIGGKTFAFHGSSYTLFNVSADTSIMVRFADKKPFVDVNVKVEVVSEGNAGGMVSPSGALSMAQGGSQTFYVFPDPGYDLEEVVANGQVVQATPIAAPQTFAMRSARVGAEAAGAEAAAGTATGAAGGYRFSVENVSEDISISVRFKKLGEGDPVPPPVTTHEVTASASSGGMISPSGTSWVVDGGSLSFALKPDAGWRLASLSVGDQDVSDQVSGNTFVLSDITAAVDVHAVFEPDSVTPPPPVTSYAVTASASEGGSIDPGGTFSVREGDSVTFTMRAKEGYRFESLVVNEVDVTEWVRAGSYVLSDVREDASVYAQFVREEVPPGECVIEARVAGGHGSVSPEGAIRVVAGSSQEFYFFPDEGYVVDAVVVDGQRLSWSPRSYRFEEVDADHTLVVSFKSAGAPGGSVDNPFTSITHAVLTKTGDGAGIMGAMLIALMAGAAAVSMLARRRMQGGCQGPLRRRAGGDN